MLPKMASIKLDDKQIEIPTDIIMAVGKDKPVIQIKWFYGTGNSKRYEKNYIR